jgi:uncharacterized protein YjbJ (UPF0337 family)
MTLHGSFQRQNPFSGFPSAAPTVRKEFQMNWDQMEGQWKQMKGKMKEKWGKLTDDDWNQIAGKKDQFLGKLQERYGYSRERAERDLEEWERSQDEPRTRTAH